MSMVDDRPQLDEMPQVVSSIPHDYTKRMMVFGGRASMELAARIAGKLDVDLGQVDLRTFADGEVYCRYQESIRGADIFLVQSTAANAAEGMTPNDALMELLVMIDAAKGASAHRIIAVMPWYGYSRQDKKSAPREPISARVVAQCLEAVGVDRVLTMDLHSGQVQGFFSKPVDHMTAMPMLTQYFMDQAWGDELVIVSPDAGRVKVARNFARKIGVHWAVMEKERPAAQVAEIGYVVGDVRGKTAVLVDDMIDTAGTLCAAAKTVLDEGAARVIACATHGVFSGPAYERLAYEESGIERIVVTDTIPLRPGAPDNIIVLSAAQTLADSIRRIFGDESVSEIFARARISSSRARNPPRGLAASPTHTQRTYPSGSGATVPLFWPAGPAPPGALLARAAHAGTPEVEARASAGHLGRNPRAVRRTHRRSGTEATIVKGRGGPSSAPSSRPAISDGRDRAERDLDSDSAQIAPGGCTADAGERRPSMSAPERVIARRGP